MFCKNCKALLFPNKDGKLVCRKCGTEITPVEEQKVITHKSRDREVAVVGEISGTLPTTDIECPDCGNRTAYWVLRQTRAADEPATRIYRCTKCSHSWREY